MPPELWGYVGWLSDDELHALKAFRVRCQDENLFSSNMMSDKDLLRFLRARKFDMEKTLKMLTDDLEWRRVFEGKNINATRDAPTILGFCKQGFLYQAGRDKDSRPVLVIKFQYAFPKEIQDTNEVVMYWVGYVHLLTQACDDYTVIADLTNFSPSKNFSLALVKLLISILQNNYPERLAYCLVTNLPAAFRLGWNLILPFLDERTKAKIHILGSNVKKLFEYIPESELEVEFGGKHAPYPKPDAFSQIFATDGVVIKTGYFDVPESAQLAAAAASTSPKGGEHPKPSRNMSSHRLDLVRKLLSRQKSSQSKNDMANGPKSSQVPKTAPRVTVFGATGQTGMLVVKRLLEKGFDVAAFVRIQGQGVPPLLLKLSQDFKAGSRLQLVVGDLGNDYDLDRAIETSDAVVSCLGAPRAVNADNEFFVSTAQGIVDSMDRNGTKRLIVVTAAQAKRMSKAWWDVNGSVAENSSRHLYWGGHYKHIAELEKYVESRSPPVEFTFARPSQLDDKSTSDAYLAEADTFFIGGQSLGRPALAKFIVDECIMHNKYVGKGVALTAPDA